MVIAQHTYTLHPHVTNRRRRRGRRRRAPQHSFIMPTPPFTDEHFIIIITTGNPAQRIHDHGHRAVRGLGWSV